MRPWIKFKVWLALWRGATVLITPEGDGYAAFKGSGPAMDRWVQEMLSKGWRLAP